MLPAIIDPDIQLNDNTCWHRSIRKRNMLNLLQPQLLSCHCCSYIIVVLEFNFCQLRCWSYKINYFIVVYTLQICLIDFQSDILCRCLAFCPQSKQCSVLMCVWCLDRRRYLIDKSEREGVRTSLYEDIANVKVWRQLKSSKKLFF